MFVTPGQGYITMYVGIYTYVRIDKLQLHSPIQAAIYAPLGPLRVFLPLQHTGSGMQTSIRGFNIESRFENQFA